MEKDIEKVIIREIEIRERVEELARRITADYEDKKLTIIGILNGSLIFLSDLIRLIPFTIKIDTIRVNTYVGDATCPERGAEIIDTPRLNIRCEHVLVVDDILDTGNTLAKILPMIKKHDPLSVKVCVLLNKRERREVNIIPDYCCFDIDNQFVVGYGLDFDNKYRNLPYIAVLRNSQVAERDLRCC
ncbi:MAG: hypoxanthine phosphoribosyltransferase [Candidatus Scalindua sp.]|nr:hypoxanthine phosphoribosyltransferase [Candidatus Scalindua sp.]